MGREGGESSVAVEAAGARPGRRGARSGSARRRPRIAFLGSRGIPARYGGFETFVEEVSPRLVEAGIEVTVFCEGSGANAPSTSRGVRLEHVRAWAPGPLRTLQFDADCLLRSWRRFDVVYMLGYGTSLLCLLPRLSGQTVWINMDGLEWRRSKWSFVARAWLWAMEGTALSAATRVIFDNASVRANVEGRRGKRAPSVVLEYGAEVYERDDEIGRLEAFGLEPGGYFLVVCRPEPENQLLEILRAHRASGARRPVAIAADVHRSGRYAREVRTLAGDRARLLGSVYDAALLRPLRRHAFAYVHGHSAGGTNPSLLESMGCGSPVVAHDNPFNRETLDGAAIFWTGESELATALRACERAPREELQALGRRGLERVAERFSWDRIAGRYAELVREAVA